ncbi:MAG: Spy/CpxP family protein refolding chaperone [Candidatus Dactylopiibacterium sp.]|nr:Spy/CpxP family protein refolding chaperone [Candidatus Dactylopiibacterium sp.]
MVPIRLTRLLVSCLLVASAAVRADEGAHPEGGPGVPPPERPGGRGDFRPQHGPASPLPGLERLRLSEGQQDRLFQLRHEQAPARHEQHKRARQAADALRALAGTPGFTPERARELARAQASAHAELLLLDAQARHQILGWLTTEQRQALTEPGRPAPARPEAPPEGAPGRR